MMGTRNVEDKWLRCVPHEKATQQAKKKSNYLKKLTIDKSRKKKADDVLIINTQINEAGCCTFLPRRFFFCSSLAPQVRVYL